LSNTMFFSLNAHSSQQNKNGMVESLTMDCHQWFSGVSP